MLILTAKKSTSSSYYVPEPQCLPRIQILSSDDEEITTFHYIGDIIPLHDIPRPIFSQIHDIVFPSISLDYDIDDFAVGEAVSLEDFNIDSTRHFIMDIQHNLTYHDKVLCPTMTLSNELQFGTYFEWVLHAYESLISRNIGPFMPHENLDIFDHSLASSIESYTQSIPWIMNTIHLRELSIQPEFINSSHINLYRIIDSYDISLLSVVHTAPSYAELKTKLTQDYHASTCFESNTLNLNEYHVGEDMDMNDDVSETDGQYDSIATHILHNEIIINSNINNLSSTNLYTKPSPEELGSLTVEEKQAVLLDTLQLVYNIMPSHLSIRLALPDNLICTSTKYGNLYENLLSGSSLFRLIPISSLKSVNINALKELCTYIRASAKPAESTDMIPLPYESGDTLEQELRKHLDSQIDTIDTLDDGESTMQSFLSIAYSQRAPIKPPSSVKEIPIKPSNLATPISSTNKQDNDKLLNVPVLKVAEIERPKVSSIGSNTSSRVTAASQNRVVSPPAMDLPRERLSNFQVHVNRDETDSLKHEPPQLKRAKVADDVSLLSKDQRQPQIITRNDKTTSTPSVQPSLTHENIVDSYLQLIDSSGILRKSQYDRSKVEPAVNQNSRTVIPPTATDSQPKNQMIFSTNTSNAIESKPYPVVNQVSPVMHVNYVDIIKPVTMTSSFKEPPTILIELNFMEINPSLTTTLAQNHNIHVVDFKITDPITVVIDIDTAISMVSSDTFINKDMLRGYLRSVISQAFKYSTIWIILVMSSPTNSSHNNTIIKFLQAISQIPAKIIFREINIGDNQMNRHDHQKTNRSNSSNAYARMIHHILHLTVSKHDHSVISSSLNDSSIASLLSSDAVFIAHCEFLSLFPTINPVLAATIRARWPLHQLSTITAGTIFESLALDASKHVHIKKSIEGLTALLSYHIGLVLHK